MSDQPKPYMPHVAQQMDAFRGKAATARRDAAKLITQAEVWVCALLAAVISSERARKRDYTQQWRMTMPK